MTGRVARIRQTDRLRLEPIGPQHASDLFRLHIDPDVATWYGGPWTREEALRRGEAFQTGWELDGVSKWIAYELKTGELIGRGGLSWWDFEGRRHLELGWALRSEHRRRGYATEIGREGIRVAFEELGAVRVYAFTEPHNERSRAVMDRLGMVHIRDFVDDQGEAFVLYEITR